MILETMTKEEVFKEIKQDEDWLRGMGYGLMKKYSKQLKDKRYGHKEILGMSSYTTPNNNRVHCVHQKYYSDKDNKYASVCFVSLYEYRCGDKLRYIYPIHGYGVFENYPCGLVVFTEHCQQRMKERLGKDMFEVLKDIATIQDTCISFSQYKYNGKDNEMVGKISTGLAFGYAHEWGVIVSTIISDSQKYDTQLEYEALSLKNMIEGSKAIEDNFEWKMNNIKGYKKTCVKQRA